MLKPVVVNVARLVCGMEKLLRSLLRDDIALHLPSPDAAATVFADHGQLTQIVLNLCVNARDAMPAGGVLAIDVAVVELAAQPDRPGGPHVELRVSDTGVGMAPEIRARIFEPFFTTKEVGKGTGLGLATVFGIVSQSRGRIAVASTPGEGTTFTLHLPRHDADVIPEVEGGAMTALRGEGTVLVVDDDAQVRAMLRTLLARNGYQVVVAESAGDALLVAEQHAGPIDLLITDVVMPRMSGPQLVERLARTRPDMAVLLCSGYAADLDRRDGESDHHGHAFLPKPFRAADLLRTVQGLLAARPGREP